MTRNNAGGAATTGSRGSRRTPAGAKTQGGREGGSTRKRTGGRASMPIDEFAEAVVRHYQEKGTVRDTLKLVRRVLVLLKDVGVRTAADMEGDDSGDIFRRFGERNASLSPHTAANRLRMLCAVIRTGYSLGLLRSLPPMPITPQVDELPGGRARCLRRRTACSA